MVVQSKTQQESVMRSKEKKRKSLEDNPISSSSPSSKTEKKDKVTNTCFKAGLLMNFLLFPHEKSRSISKIFPRARIEDTDCGYSLGCKEVHSDTNMVC